MCRPVRESRDRRIGQDSLAHGRPRWRASNATTRRSSAEDYAACKRQPSSRLTLRAPPRVLPKSPCSLGLPCARECRTVAGPPEGANGLAIPDGYNQTDSRIACDDYFGLGARHAATSDSATSWSRRSGCSARWRRKAASPLRPNALGERQSDRYFSRLALRYCTTAADSLTVR